MTTNIRHHFYKWSDKMKPTIPTLKRDAARLAMVLLASIMIALNIKIFVRAGGLFPGGVTGVSVLIQRVCLKYFGLDVPYAPLNIVLNMIPAFIGLRFIGKKFTALSIVVIVASSFFVDLLPPMAITYDTLLIAVFGGILNGLAVTVCLMADATSGGMDFISIYLSQKKGMDAFPLILCFNIVVLIIAGALFGWDKALYSIIYQYVSTQVLHIMYRSYQQQTLFIITEKPAEVCSSIFEASHHGATIIQGEGSYGHGDKAVVYSVVAGSDVRKVILAIHKVDEQAFINSIRTDSVSGNFYLRPRD